MSTHRASRSIRHRRRLRRIALALGAAAALLGLSGCVLLQNLVLTQEGLLGKIDLKITACASQTPPSACPAGTLGNGYDSTTQAAQVLVGIQVDARVQPAASFTTGFPALQPYTLSPSYSAELTRLRPPDAGNKWVGYISDTGIYTPGDIQTATIPITRPLGPDGIPATGSVLVARVIVGSRWVAPPSFPATRAVSCGMTLAPTDVAHTKDLTTCDDNELLVAANGFNEFTFLTPAPVTVAPGGTALIPVTGRLSGPAKPGLNFALAATTTLPGAVAPTNVPTLAPPGDSETTVTVSVNVPASAKPGTYTVNLTGTLATGETRSATGALTVAAPGGAARAAAPPRCRRCPG